MADSSTSGAARFGLCCAGATGAWVLGRSLPSPWTRGALGLLAVGVAGTAEPARAIRHHAALVAAEREEQQRNLAVARLGRTLGNAHQSLSSVQLELEDLLRERPDGAWRAPAEAALARLDRIADRLRESRTLRDVLADEDGRLPVVGGHAAHIPSRAGNPMRRYGDPARLPEDLPAIARRAIRNVGLVLDEIRLLHNADIERSVLNFTLAGRAALVTAAPLLGAWSSAPTPLRGGGRASTVVWLATASVAVATAIRAPALADTAMRDDADGRRLRTRLLRVEVPLSLAGLVTCPTWTVASFAAGWTNWWQRQTPGQAFHWGKLATFVAAVAGTQHLGLRAARVPVGSALGETALTLSTILVIGASYGAMLPLVLATAVTVTTDDARGSVIAARVAREELLGCARDLDATAAALTAIRDVPAADQAAAVAAQTARRLESAADGAGRRGLFVSQVIGELLDEASVHSFLPLSDSRELKRAQEAADAAGQPPPAHVGLPIYTPRELRTARLATQREARRIRALVEWALNEAHRHGTGAVRVLLSLDGDRIVLRVGDRERFPDGGRPGLASEGGTELRNLVRRLVDARVELHGRAPGSEVGLSPERTWWVVRVSWRSPSLTHRG